MRMDFLSLIGLVWYLIHAVNAAVICPVTDFQCIQSQLCIPTIKTCDSVQDCSDGSDESLNAGCETPTGVPSNLIIINTTSSTITLRWDTINDKPEDYITSYQCAIVTSANRFLDIKTISQVIGSVNITFTALFPGYLYKFRVRAVNLAGPGQYSGFVTASTSSGFLGVVTNIRVTPIPFFENTSVLIQWDPPIALVGYTVNSLTYYLSYCELNVLTSCTNLSMNSSTLQIKLSNLKSNFAYQFTITPIAVYSVGTFVGAVSSNIFNTAIIATCNNDTYFTCFQNQACVLKSTLCNGVFDCTDQSDETYAACSVPTSYPNIVSSTSINSNTISISFSVITDPSQRVQSYSFINTNTSVEQTVNASNLQPSVTTLSVTFTGLSTGVYYFFKGKALNPSGGGPYSPLYGIMLQSSVAPVDIPSNLKVLNATLTTITMVWDAINNFGQSGIISYECQLIGDSFIQSVKQDANNNGTKSAIFMGLSPDSSYSIRVRALNPIGAGPWSNNVTAYTMTGVIGKVSNLVVTPTLFAEQSSVILSWTPPVMLVGYNASSLSYIATYCELNASITCQNISSYTLQLQLTGLKTNSSYQYWFVAFATKSLKVGDLTEGTFKTSLQATCNLATQFTCIQDKSCVSKDRLCNGIFDCSDESDESLLASCSLPFSAPTIRQSVIFDSSSVGIVFSVIKDLSQRVQYYSFVNINTQVVKVVDARNLQPFVDTLVVNFTGLSPGVLYYFTGKAINPSGYGPYSSSYGVMLQSVELNGPIAGIYNVTVAPIINFESIAVKISWLPKTVGGEDPSTFQYLVSYCQLNFTSCANSSLLSQLSVNLTNLKSSTVYQYSIWVFYSQKSLGKFFTSIFETTGPIIGVFNASVVPITYLKRPAVNIFWSLPQTVSGVDPSTFQYLVSYCNLNSTIITCVNSTLTSKLSVNLTDLMSSTVYQYSIYVFYSEISFGKLFTNSFKTAEPTIGAVNASVVPILYSESTAVDISWSLPPTYGVNISTLQYFASYCEINTTNTTCVNSTFTSQLFLNLTNLKPSTVYQYSIYVLFAQNSSIKFVTGAFKTADRNNLGGNSNCDKCWTRIQKAAFSIGIIIIVSFIAGVSFYLYKRSRSDKGIINDPDNMEMS